MKTAIVNSKSFITSGYRIDPDIHLSEGVQVRHELHSLPYELSTIGDNAEKVFYGNIFSRIWVNKPEYGVPYLAASDTVLSNLDTERYLSKIQAAKLSYLYLEKDWILVTCSGTLGNVTYTNSNYENRIATHDLIRIIPNNNKVNQGTLYAFLAGKYGYHQITQSQFGGVVKHINEEQTKQIVIPVLPQNIQHEVNELVTTSARLKEDATKALNEAKQEIINYCSRPFEKSFGHKIASVKSSSIISSFNKRLDPPVFINDGVEWISSFSNSKRLGDCHVKIWYPGIFKRSYVENGYPYIKGSALFDANPFKNCDKLSRTRTPHIEELWLKEGMILISCAGLCGQVKMITKEYEDKQAIGSPDIIRLTSEDSLYTKEYLFAYLQIPGVYEYMQSLKYGSVIERFDAYNIENLPVVTPTKELSEEVTTIIKRYMDCTYRAFIAEEKAIQMVEQEIEKWNK